MSAYLRNAAAAASIVGIIIAIGGCSTEGGLFGSHHAASTSADTTASNRYQANESTRARTETANASVSSASGGYNAQRPSSVSESAPATTAATTTPTPSSTSSTASGTSANASSSTGFGSNRQMLARRESRG